MDAEFWNMIGQNTRKYRGRASLTQAEVAEQGGVGAAYISRLERGQKRMRVETLMAVANALNVSVDLIISDKDRCAQIETLSRILEGRSPEFLDGIIQIVRVCVNSFEDAPGSAERAGDTL